MIVELRTYFVDWTGGAQISTERDARAVRYSMTPALGSLRQFAGRGRDDEVDVVRRAADSHAGVSSRSGSRSTSAAVSRRIKKRS